MPMHCRGYDEAQGAELERVAHAHTHPDGTHARTAQHTHENTTTTTPRHHHRGYDEAQDAELERVFDLALARGIVLGIFGQIAV